MVGPGTRLIAAIALALLAAFPAHAADPVGAAVRIQGRATAIGADVERRLFAGAAVLFEDELRTAPQGRLLVALDDGTNLTLGSDAALRIDTFVYDPEESKGSLALSVLEGAFLFVGGAVEDVAASEVTVVTPVATIGIRGTTVWGGPLEDGYGILVLDGAVTVTTDGGSVTITEGSATMIGDRADPPAPPGAWSRDKIMRAMATVSFE